MQSSFSFSPNPSSLVDPMDLNGTNPRNVIPSRRDLVKLHESLRASQYELTKELPTKFHTYHPLGLSRKRSGNISCSTESPPDVSNGSCVVYKGPPVPLKIFYLAPMTPPPSKLNPEISKARDGISKSPAGFVTIQYSEVDEGGITDETVPRYPLLASELYDGTCGRVSFHDPCSSPLIQVAEGSVTVGQGGAAVRTQGYALAARVEPVPLVVTARREAEPAPPNEERPDPKPRSPAVAVGLSREETLLNERKRAPTMNPGSDSDKSRLASICDYEFCQRSGRFLFSLHGRLYTCTDSSIGAYPIPVLNPLTGLLHPGACRFDFRMCPTNPYLISFVCKGNLWVADLNSGEEKQLTFVDTDTEPAVSCAIPSFVMQEEFHRYTGYYWQPVSTKLRDNLSDTSHSAINQGTLVSYKILYEEVDERMVESLKLPTCMRDDLLKMEEQRFPRPGTPNAQSALKIVEFVHDSSDGRFKTCPTLPIRHYTIPIRTWFPWLEYLVRFGWTPNGNKLWVQGLSRDQKRLTTNLIPFTSFSETSVLLTGIFEKFPTEKNLEGCQSLKAVVPLFTETSATWINVTNVFRFVQSDSNTNSTTFITLSEETDYRHLYRITCSISDYANDGAHTLEKIALTTGKWDVSGEKVWIDESNQLIYFMGHKDTQLEKHLYVTSYAFPTSEPLRLTPLGFSHTIHMDQDCQTYVDTFSSLKQPINVNVYTIVSSIVPGTSQFAVHSRLAAILYTSPDSAEKYVLPPPEIFSFPAPASHSDQRISDAMQESILETSNTPLIHGMIFKPIDMHGSNHWTPSQGGRRPTLLYVYGGPHVQQVTNSYKGHRYLRLYCLTALGFTCVVIDNRGSFNMGKAFETYIHNRMGTVEIDDQIEGLRWIANSTGLVDLNRVAIHGWSYGGYLSLMGLVRRPDIFKLSIAGAPVTTWDQYDTGYTERYMGTPTSNPDGYRNGDILLTADAFPDEDDRLVLVHGLIDENVHFHNTALLVEALIKKNKPYRLMIYPNERHGIRNFEASQHFEISIMKLLLEKL